jgi:hypothetical protein
MTSLKNIAKAKYRRFQARKEPNTTDSKNSTRPQTPQSDPPNLLHRKPEFPENLWGYSSEETAHLATWFIQHQYHADRSNPMSPADRKAFLDYVEILLRKRADPNMTICVYEVGERVVHRILGARYDDDPTRGLYGGLGDAGSSLDVEAACQPSQTLRFKTFLTPFFESIILDDVELTVLFLHYGVNARDLIRHFKPILRPVKQEYLLSRSISRRFQLIRYFTRDDEVLQDTSVQLWVVRHLLDSLRMIRDFWNISHHGVDFISASLKDKILNDCAEFAAVPQQAINLAEREPFLVSELLYAVPPIHIPVALGSLELLNVTLDQGQNVRDTDRQQLSALHIAVSNTSSAMCQQLLNLGADVNTEDCFGVTPLQEAIYWGHSEAVRLLLGVGANLYPIRESRRDQEYHKRDPGNFYLGGEWRKTRNKNFARFFRLHWTVLHIAVWRGSLPIVELLIRRGALLASADHLGRLPLDLAVEIGSQEIIDMLLESGSPVRSIFHRGLRSNDPSSTFFSGHAWSFIRRLPLVWCQHVPNRAWEPHRAESASTKACLPAMCNMCRLVDGHRRQSTTRAIQYGATVTLILRQIRDTQRWEMNSRVSGTNERRHTVDFVPCM